MTYLRSLCILITFAIVSVLIAHALTFVLLRFLPEPATVSLGIHSTNTQAFAAFKEVHKPRSYLKILHDLSRGRLGKTLDGLPVRDEIRPALKATLPRMAFALSGILILGMGTALLLKPRGWVIDVAGFFHFLPPFIWPFIILLFVLLVDTSSLADEDRLSVYVTLSILITPAALIMSQSIGIMQDQLRSRHGKMILAMGASPLWQRVKLAPNWFVEALPSLEKMLTGLFVTILFAEPILGTNGLGTTSMRAIQRSDPELLLACVLVMALTINLARILIILTRSGYHVEESF